MNTTTSDFQEASKGKLEKCGNWFSIHTMAPWYGRNDAYAAGISRVVASTPSINHVRVHRGPIATSCGRGLRVCKKNLKFHLFFLLNFLARVSRIFIGLRARGARFIKYGSLLECFKTYWTRQEAADWFPSWRNENVVKFVRLTTNNKQINICKRFERWRRRLTTRSLLITSIQRNKDKDEWRLGISRDGGYRPFWTSRFMCICASESRWERASPAPAPVRGPRAGGGAEGTSHTDSTIMVSWVCIIIDRPWCDWYLSGTPVTI